MSTNPSTPNPTPPSIHLAARDCLLSASKLTAEMLARAATHSTTEVAQRLAAAAAAGATLQTRVEMFPTSRQAIVTVEMVTGTSAPLDVGTVILHY
jgi:hypothetical protein